MNTNKTILHAFDPNKKFLPPKPGEVRFVQGKYIDIANKKGKDKNSLYFGTSNNSKLLTGIFLGDNELTSKVKDISLVNENNNIVLTVKYINEQNKLATVKTKLLSSKAIEDITGDLSGLTKHLKTIDSSINKLENKLNIINSSVSLIETELNIVNTSLNDLIDDLNDGKYNYTLQESIGSFEDGYIKSYTLFKGDSVQTDSSVITLTDYVLKKLEYDDESNKIIATVFPDSCGDDIYQWEHIPNPDGGEDQLIKKAKLKDEYIRKIELSLDALETHIINNITTNSSLNERLTFVENQLKWEELFD